MHPGHTVGYSVGYTVGHTIRRAGRIRHIVGHSGATDGTGS